MSSDTAIDIASVRGIYGATLAGTLVGAFLSGIVFVQLYLYIRVYPRDPRSIKTMVGLIWLLDFLHTCFIAVGSWKDLIERYGDWPYHDRISWSVGVSVALTALVTFLVQCFFVYRIYKISVGNKMLTIPMVILALFRLVSAAVTSAEMVRLASYSTFIKKYGFLLTTGLCPAVTLDIMITVAMTFYLRRNKSDFSTLNDIIDTLIVYTVQTGMLTSCITIAVMACWLSMPHYLIFLGLHFTIPKLYANSFLAMLNSRVTLVESSHSTSNVANRRRPIMLSKFNKDPQDRWARARSASVSKALEISVQMTVDHDISPGEARSRADCYELSEEETDRSEEPKALSTPV
ncbi:hypothetical protein PsYK624_079890 [Phanerochaete sordida]|uniref:DUF6534 domain-containing protein n=1 Tax=Phanerochaete sordida TaxID=48140 RepID=A0A9P3GBH7_9APHY|nr:hypothetical protein PsYK624_079890 [Phanerochaete sordida]